MTIRSQMTTAAKRAGVSLGSSSKLVIDFLSNKINTDGGFCGRDSGSDLYYTLFGIESLIALGVDFDQDRTADYLRTFHTGKSLDFVHLACLLRCWANLSDIQIEDHNAKTILKRLNSFRCLDGGYSVLPNAKNSSVYANFLAIGAHQDANIDIDQPQKIINSILSLQGPDFGFANESSITTSLTPSTAAAIVSLISLGEIPTADSIKWLLDRITPSGGFLPTPSAPIPDLLSTATALFALDVANQPLDTTKEPCLDFLDSLWSKEGGFRGCIADSTLDCEYTYYGLLSIGLLSNQNEYR